MISKEDILEQLESDISFYENKLSEQKTKHMSIDFDSLNTSEFWDTLSEQWKEDEKILEQINKFKDIYIYISNIESQTDIQEDRNLSLNQMNYA